MGQTTFFVRAEIVKKERLTPADADVWVNGYVDPEKEIPEAMMDMAGEIITNVLEHLNLLVEQRQFLLDQLAAEQRGAASIDEVLDCHSRIAEVVMWGELPRG